MKKVLLIGSGGAGKSTLAKQLGAKTGLPVIHLDARFWQPGWKPTPSTQWQAMLKLLLQEPAWIMDGNFGGTLALRLSQCDTVILLNFPPLLCFWRVLVRRLRFHGRARPDMTLGCPERLDVAFLGWILSYRRVKLPSVLAQLAAAEHAGKTVIVLRNSSEVRRFLAATVCITKAA